MTVSGVRGEAWDCAECGQTNPYHRGTCIYRAVVFAGAPAGRGVDGGGDVKCERCAGEHDLSTEFCCSSHGKRLCHDCYKRTHFVEGICCDICRAKARAKLSPLADKIGRTLFAQGAPLAAVGVPADQEVRDER